MKVDRQDLFCVRSFDPESYRYTDEDSPCLDGENSNTRLDGIQAKSSEDQED